MTYRERVAIEHPEAIKPIVPGGVIGCPHNYGYETKQTALTACRFGEVGGACAACWGRQAPPRKVKPRRKEHEKANG